MTHEGWSPRGVAVDANHLYWSNEGTTSISRANSTGGEVETSWITPQDTYPLNVAVDGGHIYWAGIGRIGRADLEGGEEEPLWIPGLTNAWDVAVDAGHVYWAELGSPSKIGRASLSGEKVEVGWMEAEGMTDGLAVGAGHVYWSNYLASSIGRANLAGEEVEPQWITGVSQPSGVAVDAGHVYWASQGTGSIGRANLAGGEVEAAFRSVTGDIEGLVVDPRTAEPSTTALSFGAAAAVPQGSLSAPQPVTYTNEGLKSLDVQGFAFGGADPGDFLTSSDTCHAPVAPGSSCTVEVRFAPQAQGDRTATMTALSDASVDPVAQLSGSAGPLPAGPTGPAGATGSAGPAGSTGQTGPQGLAGKNAKVTCKVAGKKSVKVTCKVEYPGGSTSARVAWHLTRSGRTVAHGLTATRDGRLVLGRKQLGNLRSGRYVLRLDGGRASLVISVS